ncbi:hypothetical protein PVAND_004353 [Polypedilum vanderplanki]|uniref:Transcriptional coactivator p15 (PC4) C-terminal domain-containing protein n=1 Tax=Polypedilum vanderplanki TaxID=319348 RepID=A0A9J6BXV9_POLVA|nr:hypothetical protein PVAND_004353 [Polypedilum vanderplanki]
MAESSKSKDLLDTSDSEHSSPKVKKQKKEKKNVGENSDKPVKVLKRKSENTNSLNALTDEDGNEYFDIGRSRRVAMSDFKGKKFLNIREYYQNKDGNMAPGKKGITLNKNEWENLLALADKFDFSEE